MKNTVKQHKEAIADFDEAIRLKPVFAAAYFNRGLVKNAVKQHKEALADFDEAIRLKLDYAVAYNNRGHAKAALGLKDVARKDFEAALELARKAGDVDLRAVVEQSLRDLDDAEGS